jgi:hypothetical protein
MICRGKVFFLPIWQKLLHKLRWVLISTTRIDAERSTLIKVWCNVLSSEGPLLVVLPALCLLPNPDCKVYKLQYKAKQSYVKMFVYSLVPANIQFLRVQPMASLCHNGVNQLKFAQSSVCFQEVSWIPLWGSKHPDFLLDWWRFNTNYWVLLINPLDKSYQKKILTLSGAPNQS